MLIRFSSTATEPLIMFGDIAVQLIKMMGASGTIPGALHAEDIPAAIASLRSELAKSSEANNNQGSPTNDDREESDREPVLALSTRAAPLIDLLERAAKANAPFMWEAN